MLQQGIAGMKRTVAPWDIGMNVARTRQGLPRLIDRRDRQLIILGDVTIIRLWLTLFGLYRVVDFRGKLKLQTITKPGLDLSSNGMIEIWGKWLPSFLSRLELRSGLPSKARVTRELTPNFIPLIRKASPNSGGLSSVAGLPLDIVMWSFVPEGLKLSFSRFLQEVDGLELVWGLKPFITKVQSLIETERVINTRCFRIPPFGMLKPKEPDVPVGHGVDAQRCHHDPFGDFGSKEIITRTISKLQEEWGPVGALGRLGFKYEPGKIRVFAMVDCLTQALMQPLHEWLFKRLEKLSTDGTFNQSLPLANLVKRMNDAGKTWIASYDLSAATDRLPVVLQEMILEQCTTTAYARHWRNLLVGRPYKLPKEAKSWNLGFSEVVYEVGQPMGALSSWAMLAVTHHAIVQLAASRVLGEYEKAGWFMDYAVLGDDVVIADKAVASEYLKLMALIGVEIGLAKSLVSSQGTFEFAKRTYFKGVDVSMLSLAEMTIALRNVSALIELAKKNLKFNKLRVASIARFAGFGYRNLARLNVIWGVGNRLGRLSGLLHAPGSLYPVGFACWVSASGPGQVARPMNQWRVAVGLWTTLVNRAVDMVVSIERLLPYIGLYSYSYGENRKPTQKEISEVRAGIGLGRLRNGLVAVRGYLGQPGRGLDGVFSENAFNSFFLEWVVRPYHDLLWKQKDQLNETIRLIDPYILPKWEDLDQLWTNLFSWNSEGSRFPKSVEILRRKSDEVPEVKDGGRLLRLWLILRKVVSRGLSCDLSLATQTRTWPKATRRWDRGLGQDRVNMGSQSTVNQATGKYPEESQGTDWAEGVKGERAPEGSPYRRHVFNPDNLKGTIYE